MTQKQPKGHIRFALQDLPDYFQVWLLKNLKGFWDKTFGRLEAGQKPW